MMLISSCGPPGQAVDHARSVAGVGAPTVLAAGDPAICGDWSSVSAITARYGEIRNCFAVEAAHPFEWIVTTLGKATGRGVVAVYRCGDAACRDGRADHPLAGWRFIAAPNRGGVTLVGSVSPTVLIVSNGGHQITFDAVSLRFGR